MKFYKDLTIDQKINAKANFILSWFLMYEYKYPYPAISTHQKLWHIGEETFDKLNLK